MPEGDSLHKLAHAIRPHLVGQAVQRLRIRHRGDVGIVRGLPIDTVEVVGKHLLVDIARRFTFHLHLGLHGRWRGHHGTPPSTRAIAASTALLAVPQFSLLVHRSSTHEIHRYRDLRLEQQLRKLGPDILAPDVDLDAIVLRARAAGFVDVAITDLLLDQSVACGIGNVYRSEALFVGRIDPWRTVSAMNDETVRTAFATAQTLMRSNLQAGPRATVGPRRGARRQPGVPRLWVYRRAGLPCLRCRTIIKRSYEGRQARSTYWCPRCQRPEAGPDLQPRLANEK